MMKAKDAKAETLKAEMRPEAKPRVLGLVSKVAARADSKSWWTGLPRGERVVIRGVFRILRKAKRSHVPELAQAAVKWERSLGCFVKVRLKNESRVLSLAGRSPRSTVHGPQSTVHSPRSTVQSLNMALKRFTKPKFLEQIGRGLLRGLVGRYQAAFAGSGVALPDESLGDREYYAALARLALMADADLFRQKLDEVRIASLSSFEYHGSEEPVDRRATFVAPDAAGLARIKGDIDNWVSAALEGDERATEVEWHEVDGEHWFLIRRGDALARVPILEGGVFTVRHFRPARDLLVAYSPERDELRVYARGVREKRMLRRVFGRRLFNDAEYFSVRKAFTLKPLRDDGPDALEAPPGGGIDRVVLTELGVRTNEEHDAIVYWRASDLFAFGEATGQQIIPPGGQLVSAGFQVHFTGQARPRKVYVRAGNKLRLARHCDAAAVHRWLVSKGFRSAEEEAVNRVFSLSCNQSAPPRMATDEHR